ncbi:hypothetical protein [Tistrella mobilis]|uniref:hypothetical protein n=1 Tax=Tistrella mobilis TaxID=171437 RepID=UPI00355692BC
MQIPPTAAFLNAQTVAPAQVAGYADPRGTQTVEAVPAAGKVESNADRQPPPPQASGRGSVLDITV